MMKAVKTHQFHGMQLKVIKDGHIMLTVFIT